MLMYNFFINRISLRANEFRMLVLFFKYNFVMRLNQTKNLIHLKRKINSFKVRFFNRIARRSDTVSSRVNNL